MKKNKTIHKEKGITLIALILTIAIIMIIASVSIGLVISKDNGLFLATENAGKDFENASKQDENDRKSVVDALDQDDTGLKDTPKYDKSVEEAMIGTLNDDIIVKDEINNTFRLPAGFKIAADSGKTIAEGIVIEDNRSDSPGSQFVWIPVDLVNKKEGDSIVQVDLRNALGRYENGVLKQDGSSYIQTTELTENDTMFVEYADSGMTLNTNAYNLEEFISSVGANKGFYVSRYVLRDDATSINEKSDIAYIDTNYWNEHYLDVDENNNAVIKNESALYKLITQCLLQTYNYNAIKNTTSSLNTVYNFITQAKASLACRNLYKDNDELRSDLPNSYAEDTMRIVISELPAIGQKLKDLNSTYETWTTETGINDKAFVARSNTGVRKAYSENEFEIPAELLQYKNDYEEEISKFSVEEMIEAIAGNLVNEMNPAKIVSAITHNNDSNKKGLQIRNYIYNGYEVENIIPKLVKYLIEDDSEEAKTMREYILYGDNLKQIMGIDRVATKYIKYERVDFLIEEIVTSFLADENKTISDFMQACIHNDEDLLELRCEQMPDLYEKIGNTGSEINEGETINENEKFIKHTTIVNVDGVDKVSEISLIIEEIEQDSKEMTEILISYNPPATIQGDLLTDYDMVDVNKIKKTYQYLNEEYVQVDQCETNLSRNEVTGEVTIEKIDSQIDINAQEETKSRERFYENDEIATYEVYDYTNEEWNLVVAMDSAYMESDYMESIYKLYTGEQDLASFTSDEFLEFQKNLMTNVYQMDYKYGIKTFPEIEAEHDTIVGQSMENNIYSALNPNSYLSLGESTIPKSYFGIEMNVEIKELPDNVIDLTITSNPEGFFAGHYVYTNAHIENNGTIKADTVYENISQYASETKYMIFECDYDFTTDNYDIKLESSSSEKKDFIRVIRNDDILKAFSKNNADDEWNLIDARYTESFDTMEDWIMSNFQKQLTVQEHIQIISDAILAKMRYRLINNKTDVLMKYYSYEGEENLNAGFLMLNPNNFNEEEDFTAYGSDYIVTKNITTEGNEVIDGNDIIKNVREIRLDLGDGNNIYSTSIFTYVGDAAEMLNGNIVDFDRLSFSATGTFPYQEDGSTVYLNYSIETPANKYIDNINNTAEIDALITLQNNTVILKEKIIEEDGLVYIYQYDDNDAEYKIAWIFESDDCEIYRTSYEASSLQEIEDIIVDTYMVNYENNLKTEQEIQEEYGEIITSFLERERLDSLFQTLLTYYMNMMKFTARPILYYK